MNVQRQLILFLTTILISALSGKAQTKLMHQPALSDSKIAFIYAEDLWVANRDGSNPQRLTIDEGIESNPIFSPDGSLIAFNAQYDGNSDVFIIPVSGGIPKRLTWHPYRDFVADFSADGKSLLFVSQRNSFTNRFAQLYTIPVNGGAITQLNIPTAFAASFSDDNSHIAYSPNYNAFNQWKHYRGGTATRIWLYNTTTHKVDEIPKPEGGSNDAQPQWMSNKIYFKSDRDGEFNLYGFNTSSKKIEKLTNYTDFPVVNINTYKGSIIYEQAGTLHIYNTKSKTDTPVSITITTDLLELRERYVSGKNYVRSGAISPSGARAVVDFRGDIITVPAVKGDPTNITATTGTHEKYPNWSPDGKSIAYFSDESGEYALHIKDLSTEQVNIIPLNGTGFYANIHWAPNSKKLCFVDNGRNLYVTDVATKYTSKINSDVLYFPGVFRELFGSWSHDSNWVTYTIITETNFERAYAYSLAEKVSYPLSDGLSNVTEPTFDPSGKYIYMLASTDAGPLVNWFDQSNIDKELTQSIYLVTLQKEVPSPLAKENDEEKPEPDKKKEDQEEGKKKRKIKNNKKGDVAEKTLKIDWPGFQERILNLPIAPGVYSNLRIANEGELFYLSSSFHSPKTSLNKFDLKKRKKEELMEASNFEISANGKKMLYITNGGAWYISDLGAKSKEGAINLDVITVKINPKNEWENIFNEAWRVNRDYFYDPGIHGADWNAMKAKYHPFLKNVSCRNDLYGVMQWMFSELAVGHHRFSSRGDKLHNPKSIKA